MTAAPAPPPTRTEPPEKETSRTSVAGAREMARDTTDPSSNNPATRGNTRMTRSTGDDPLDVWYRAELAATMRPCPELSRTQRDADRKHARAVQRSLEEMALEAVHRPSTDAPDLHTPLSTGCAENGPAEPDWGAA